MTNSRWALLLLFCGCTMLANCWQVEVVPCGVAHCVECDGEGVNCIACDGGYYLDDDNGVCTACDTQILNCTACSVDNSTVTCNSCSSSLLPSDDALKCQQCNEIIPHCLNCLDRVDFQPRKCDLCEQDYEYNQEHRCVEKESNATTIIIVTCIVGGIVLIGVGFAIFKCMRKKKGVSRLLQDEDI